MRSDDDFHELRAGLPPELARLHDELAGLRIDERPSFAPELAAELRGAARLPGGARSRPRSTLAAAAVALLFVGLSVPPARASLVRAGTSFVRLLEGSREREAPQGVSGRRLREVPFDEAPLTVAAPVLASPPARVETRAEPSPAPPFRPPSVTLPEVLDPRADIRLMRRYYPPLLQASGVGGTVDLLLWVDSTGKVDHVQIREGSGYPELDRAALQAAPHLRFRAATRDRRPVGTWVEFPLTFAVEPPAPRAPAALAPPPAPDDGVPLPEEWAAEPLVAEPPGMGADELLRSALGFSPTDAGLGPLQGLLEGEPPRGLSPFAWREDAAAVLERATVRAPDNPTPYLALARIRRKQGLKAESRTLFEEGLRRALRPGGRISSDVVSALGYELGLLLREEGHQGAEVGTVTLGAGRVASCPRAGGALREGAVVETLLTWSYVCPEALDRVLAEGFQVEAGGAAARSAALASFATAAGADPAHVGANVEVLLNEADGERWEQLLGDARRFARLSGGHPYAFLLGGLALQRLGRAEEAADAIRLALEGLPAEEADRLSDPRPLMSATAAARLDVLGDERRHQVVRDFWASLDPVLATDVNERFVEHVVRGGYALLRFGSAVGDPGSVWVRYGRPLHLRVLGEASGLRAEFWDYGGGPDITFRRPPSAGAVDLTAEARAYLEDLRKVFPHRYGSEGRMVSALPAQIARFLSDQGTDLVVRTRVPSTLATGGGDSLAVGLFQLGPSGERVSADRRWVPARVQEVEFRVRAAPGAASVALEIFHPGLNHAVAVRESVAREGDPRSSDLLLARADARDGLVVPLAAGDALDGDEVGAYFETTERAAVGDLAGLTVELVPAGGGAAMPVPFRAVRPARRRVERAPASDAATSRFLVLDLRSVPEGPYFLRVGLEPGTGSEPLVLERAVQRR